MAERYFAPCPRGLEAPLAAELGALGASNAATVDGGVAFEGDLPLACRANLESRLASRILWRIGGGSYRDERDLYELARTVAWSDWITPRQTLRVDSTAQRSPLRSLNFAALRVKDAVCDRMREEHGVRPNVDTVRPDLAIVLHAGAERAAIYVDSSGESLFKRGWREDQSDAPLKETLAAAMLAAAGWRGTPAHGGALHDPCCGSGTIAIEAAQIAMGLAPGRLRRFAFERLLPFAASERRADWQRLKSKAAARVHASAVPIFASDISFRMVDFARRNAARAGVAAAIEFHGGDALERPAPALPPELPGTLLVNPPYGERIEVAGKAASARRSSPSVERDAPDDFFARLAAHWKRAYTAHPAGWTAWILSPDPKLPSAMRLKESRRVPMWNGPIECRLFRFDLVAGSARAPRKPA